MKVLFLSAASVKKGSGREFAYSHRLDKLSSALRQYDVQIEYLSLRDQPVSRPLLLQPLNLPFLRSKIAGYDFIHAGGTAAYTAACMKPLIKTRVIYDVDGDLVSEAQLQQSTHPNPIGFYWVMQAQICNSIACRGSDFFITVSRPLEERLITEFQVPACNIGIVRNGVDLQLFDQTAQSYKSGVKFIVAYAGGFQCWQGIDNLVSAFQLFTDERVQLKIIGFSEQQVPLKASILNQLGSRVELVDRMPQKDLVSHLASANVLIIPRSPHRAIEVAFPTKFSEYLALRKPVIVTDVDETASLVRQHRCGLVSAPDPAALASTILTVANMAQGELDLMGQNARLLAEKEFSWNVIGRKYFDLLSEWICRDPRP